MRGLVWIYSLVILRAALAVDFPPPLELGPTNEYGRELQRSMRLMADSPATKKRTVRVLFYGQSVTEEIWSTWLGDYLRQSYPNANLVITNLAIGYTSELLWKTAEIDIPNFYPDLMIFQDYGSDTPYETMVELTRRRTTADILIQTDHIHMPEDVDEPTDPATPGGLPDRAYHNYVVLPEIAKKYGGELGDVRTYWKKYLKDYDLQVPQLLRDHIHPNLQGSFLMSELLKPYLHADPSFPSDDWSKAEKNYQIGQDVYWSDDDILQLDFVGNRVDVIAESSGDRPIQVQIDGRKPSEFPELYNFTRTDFYPDTWWLSIVRITSQRPLIEEQWTARILEFSTNTGVPFARFEVEGSRTGPDGEGSITDPFISTSGRVVIDPSEWLMFYWAASYYPILQPLPVGHEIHWTSSFAGKDEFVPQVTDPTLETTITLAQGLANGPHTLKLTRKGSTTISGIRIYNPLARTQPLRFNDVAIREIKMVQGSLLIEINDLGRHVLESSPDCSIWEPFTAPTDDVEISVPLEQSRRFFRVRVID